MMEELENVKKALEDEKSSIYSQVHVLQEELVSPNACACVNAYVCSRTLLTRNARGSMKSAHFIKFHVLELLYVLGLLL